MDFAPVFQQATSVLEWFTPPAVEALWRRMEEQGAALRDAEMRWLENELVWSVVVGWRSVFTTDSGFHERTVVNADAWDGHTREHRRTVRVEADGSVPALGWGPCPFVRELVFGHPEAEWVARLGILADYLRDACPYPHAHHFGERLQEVIDAGWSWTARRHPIFAQLSKTTEDRP